MAEKKPIKTDWSPRVTEAIDAIHEANLSYVVAHIPGKGLYVTNITKFEDGVDHEVRINTLTALATLMQHELRGTSEFLAFIREDHPDHDDVDEEALGMKFGKSSFGIPPKDPDTDPAVRGG